VNKWALSLVKNVARVEQLRMFAGSWFQAEGPATENELSARWRLERGMMKSPREVDRRRVSIHGSQSSVRYDGAAPWTIRYIKQHSLYETLASMGSQCRLQERKRWTAWRSAKNKTCSTILDSLKPLACGNMTMSIHTVTIIKTLWVQSTGPFSFEHNFGK